VIFDKARSMASHVKAFRHFRNQTVPEVTLAFDVEGKSWLIHKRFAGQAGKASLTCSDGITRLAPAPFQHSKGHWFRRLVSPRAYEFRTKFGKS